MYVPGRDERWLFVTSIMLNIAAYRRGIETLLSRLECFCPIELPVDLLKHNRLRDPLAPTRQEHTGKIPGSITFVRAVGRTGKSKTSYASEQWTFNAPSLQSLLREQTPL